MTEATHEAAPDDARRADALPQLRLIGVICAAHFMSHFYILILAPLLPFVRAAYGVSYTEIGLALSAFNVVSAALQTPAGFLVDWLGARALLIAGLIVGAAAFIVVGLVDSFWVLVAMFGLAGVGNTVYHPADYALLSQNVPAKRIGQAFSVHTFAGMLGSAVAPAGLLIMQNYWGWRGAFIGAGVLGLAVASLFLFVGEDEASKSTRVTTAKTGPAKTGPAKSNPAKSNPAKSSPTEPANGQTAWQLLLSAPILLNLFFFFMIALNSGGMFNYSVVALGALYGTPVATANTALTILLLLSALGVLAGGVLVTRTTRHGLVAGLGLLGMGITAALIGSFDFGTVALILVMIGFGFCFGFISPSRDMIVREVTPPGSFGKVFGFVTTGFNLGGIISPMIFGALMDHGAPRMVFFAVAAFSVIAILAVATIPKQRGEA